MNTKRKDLDKDFNGPAFAVLSLPFFLTPLATFTLFFLPGTQFLTLSASSRPLPPFGLSLAPSFLSSAMATPRIEKVPKGSTATSWRRSHQPRTVASSAQRRAA